MGCMSAFGTGIDVMSQGCGTAVSDGTQSFELLVIYNGTILVQKPVPLRSDNIGKLECGPVHFCTLRR